MPRIKGTDLASFQMQDNDSTPAFQEIRAGVTSADFSNSFGLFDVTTVDSDSMQRDQGLKDASLTLECLITDDTNAKIETVFETNGADNPRKTNIQLKASPNKYWRGYLIVESLDYARGQDGDLRLSISMQGAGSISGNPVAGSPIT